LERDRIRFEEEVQDSVNECHINSDENQDRFSREHDEWSK